MFDNIKVNDILVVKEEIIANLGNIENNNTVVNTFLKGTILKVLGVSKSKEIIVVSKYYCSNGHVFSITDEDKNKLKVIATNVVFDVNDVVKCTNTFMAYYENQNAQTLCSVLKDELVVIRGINNKGEYKATIVSGSCEGTHIRFYIDTAWSYFSMVGNTLINDVFKKPTKVKKTYKCKPFQYKDEVVYYKSLVSGNKIQFAKLGNKYKFVAYCKEPIYTKRAVGIPLDCVVQNNNHEVVLANSTCLKPYKQNNCYNKHEFTIKVKDNKLKFVDKVNSTFELQGVSICKEVDKFDIKTGLLLAIARAYKDKALEDFALDKFKD